MRRLALGRFGSGLGVDIETRLARIEAALGEVELASHVGSVGDLPTTLTDPNATKTLYWDDAAKEFKFLNSGAGISIDPGEDGENSLAIHPNLQAIAALAFAPDKLIRITDDDPPTADLIDFRMGLYTPTAIIIQNTDSVTPLESMYFNIGPLVGAFGRLNITPSSGTNTQIVRLSIPLASDFANPRDCVGTASSVVLGVAQIEADATNNEALFTLKTSGGSVSTAFSFTFWYRILPWP